MNPVVIRLLSQQLIAQQLSTLIEVLKVLLWGEEIGRLAWHDTRKTSFFMYNPEFLKVTLDIVVLAASIIRSVFVPFLVRQSVTVRDSLRSSLILCPMHREVNSSNLSADQLKVMVRNNFFF